MSRYTILLAALLCGCMEPDPYEAKVVPPAEGPHQRFRVEIQGRFNAGYENHRRDILLITDTKTGKQYLTVTGCGTTELWVKSDGDTSHTEEE